MNNQLKPHGINNISHYDRVIIMEILQKREATVRLKISIISQKDCFNIRSEQQYSEPVEIRLGVRKECVLSPLSFNLYTVSIDDSLEKLAEN